MEKRITQRIAIGLVSFSLLALIGFNIYEYKKVKYIPQIMDAEMFTNKASKGDPPQTKITQVTPVSTQVSNYVTKEVQVNKSGPDNLQIDPPKNEFKTLDKQFSSEETKKLN